MASIAYSTWKRRPSGEKVFTPLSYSERVRYILLLFDYYTVVLVSMSVVVGRRRCVLFEVVGVGSLEVELVLDFRHNKVTLLSTRFSSLEQQCL